MKNQRFERMRASQQAFHRNCQWVMEQGIYALHLYEDRQPDALSWWDDVGFILGKRRVIVWWIHPRQRYLDVLDEQAWQEAGEPPRESDPLERAIVNYKRAGRSRKIVSTYSVPPAADALRQYYDKLDAIRQRLEGDGIGLQVEASWRRERLPWATAVSLVAPLEVNSRAELQEVAGLARRLLRGETTLDREFPAYRYGKEQWLAERRQQETTKVS